MQQITRITKAQASLLRDIERDARRQAGADVGAPSALNVRRVLVAGSSRVQCADRLVGMGLLRRRGGQSFGGTPFSLTDAGIEWLQAHEPPSPHFQREKMGPL